MRDVLIAGAGMTRFGKFMDRSTRSLAEEATVAALEDAATPVEEVGMVFFGNAASGLVTGQEMIRGQAALRNTGLLGLPMVKRLRLRLYGRAPCLACGLFWASGGCHSPRRREDDA